MNPCDCIVDVPSAQLTVDVVLCAPVDIVAPVVDGGGPVTDGGNPVNDEG